MAPNPEFSASNPIERSNNCRKDTLFTLLYIIILYGSTRLLRVWDTSMQLDSKLIKTANETMKPLGIISVDSPKYFCFINMWRDIRELWARTN